jgi:hypothetical protein
MDRGSFQRLDKFPIIAVTFNYLILSFSNRFPPVQAKHAGEIYPDFSEKAFLSQQFLLSWIASQWVPKREGFLSGPKNT